MGKSISKHFSLWLILLISFAFSSQVDAKKTIKILCIGNSFTVDAFEDYLAPLGAADDVDFVLGYPYKGGTTMAMHCDYVSNNTPIYNYKKIVNGVLKSKSSTVLLQSIVDESWDYVIFQTDHNNAGIYDAYFPYLTTLMDYVKAHCTNPDVKFGMYVTWAYDSSSTYSAFSLYGRNQMTMYNAIIDCAYRAAAQVGIDLVIPVGTAIQNARTSVIGDHMNRDGYHLNFDYGRYIASCTWYEKITGKPVIGNRYHPETLDAFYTNLCQNAAHLAIEIPKAISSMVNEWGKEPEGEKTELKNSIFINFDVNYSTVVLPAPWNSISSNAAGTVITKLGDSKGNETTVGLKIIDAFGGLLSSGATETTTDWNMPGYVSQRSYWGNGAGVYNNKQIRFSSFVISGLYPGQVYDLGLFASIMNIAGNRETEYRVNGVNEVVCYLTPANNTTEIAYARDVIAPESGEITVTVKNGPNNTDAKKLFHLAAMELIPHYTAPIVKTKMPVYINLTQADKTTSEANWNDLIGADKGIGLTQLVDSAAVVTKLSIKVDQSFGGIFTNGMISTNTVMKMPSNASSTGFWCNGVERDGILCPSGVLLLAGFDPALSYDFGIFASVDDDAQVYEAEYTLTGKNERFAVLNANKNVDNVVWVTNVIPDANGTIELMMTSGPSSNDTYKMAYINAIEIRCPASASTPEPDPEEKPIYVNFTNTSGVTAESYWNDLTSPTLGTTITNLVNANTEPTDVSVTVTTAFGGVNSNGATSTTTPLNMPALASGKGFWGNGAGLVNNKLVPIGLVTFSGLKVDAKYDFSVFASSTFVQGVLEGEYTLTGSNTVSGCLDAYGNSSRVLTLSGVQPNTDGQIKLKVTAGANNTSTTKMFFLNALMLTQQDNVTSIWDTADDAIHVWPNPATDHLNVNVPHNVNRLIVYSLSGMPILLFDPTTSGITTLDISTLPVGFYLLKIGNQSVPFIKK